MSHQTSQMHIFQKVSTMLATPNPVAASAPEVQTIFHLVGKENNLGF